MPGPKSILIVEDEADLAELLCYNLEREGYRCRRAADGAAALEEVRQHRPDLMILDRMLPHVSGDEVMRQVKEDPRVKAMPIVMLTAKAEETDELAGFALGADDYVTKPFSMKLLLARVEAVLNRAVSDEEAPDVLTAGPITLDRDRYEMAVDGTPVALTSTEFRILEALMAASGRVLSRAQLINTVLGPSVAVTDRTIDVHIAALRKKLADAAGWIQTIRGVGYTLRMPQPA
jgi:two-component system phosphate regulon response regulator PhoB